MKHAMLVVVVAALTPGMAFAGSLADAAKKEKERREKNKEAGVTAVRTITQDDVKTNDSPSEAGGSYTGGSSAESDAPSGSMAAPPPGDHVCCGEALGASSRSGSSEDERAWRSRATAARGRVERARKKLANTPARLMEHKRYGNGGFTMRDNPSYKYAEEELKNAEAALNDMEEDARRQRIPPGWLR